MLTLALLVTLDVNAVSSLFRLQADDSRTLAKEEVVMMTSINFHSGKLKTKVGKHKTISAFGDEHFSKNVCSPWPESMPAPRLRVM